MAGGAAAQGAVRLLRLAVRLIAHVVRLQLQWQLSPCRDGRLEKLQVKPKNVKVEGSEDWREALNVPDLE